MKQIIVSNKKAKFCMIEARLCYKRRKPRKIQGLRLFSFPTIPSFLRQLAKSGANDIGNHHLAMNFLPFLTYRWPGSVRSTLFPSMV